MDWSRLPDLAAVTLLATAFGENRLDLLRVAMDDRIHQPSRSEAFPYLYAAIEAAKQKAKADADAKVKADAEAKAKANAA